MSKKKKRVRGERKGAGTKHPLYICISFKPIFWTRFEGDVNRAWTRVCGNVVNREYDKLTHAFPHPFTIHLYLHGKARIHTEDSRVHTPDVEPRAFIDSVFLIHLHNDT